MLDIIDTLVLQTCLSHRHVCTLIHMNNHCQVIQTILQVVFTSLHFTLLSLKRICILQLMITSKIYGMVTTKCKWISRCIHYKNNSTGWHQYDSFSIQHSNGHRQKTPAIARCFTFYTTVSPLRRKYMEERRERVIRLSSDSTSFLQNCMVDYFGELWCR